MLEKYEALLHRDAADPGLSPERRAQLEERMRLLQEERRRGREWQRGRKGAPAAAPRGGALGDLSRAQAAVGAAVAAGMGGSAAARRDELVSHNQRLRAAVEGRRPDVEALLAEARRQLEEEEAAAAAAEAAAAAAAAEQEEEEEEAKASELPFGGMPLIGELRRGRCAWMGRRWALCQGAACEVNGRQHAIPCGLVPPPSQCVRPSGSRRRSRSRPTRPPPAQATCARS
jgi:hypothetical protein